MFDILTLNKIAACGLSRLDPALFRSGDAFDAPDGVIVRSADMKEMELPASLKAIARAGAGTNNIPVDACAEKGIVVFNTPGANANAVKELTICALFLASRKIVAGSKWTETLKGEGDEVGKKVEKGKSQFVGPEIAGKTLAVIGLGAIGVKVANAALGLGMKIVGYDPFISEAAKASLDASVAVETDLRAVLAAADYITIHCPSTPDTKGMINADSLAGCKDGVRIVNLARGDLVVSADLIAAVDSGKVGAYVTDFPTDGMLCRDGITALPHLGASTPESEDNCAVMAADEISDYLVNGNIRNSVNFPAVLAERSGAQRVCVLSEGDVSGEVAAILPGAKITSAARKRAYLVADLADAADAEAIAKIEALGGVYAVRVI